MNREEHKTGMSCSYGLDNTHSLHLSSPFFISPWKNWSLLKWLLSRTDSRTTHSRHLNGIASVYPLIGRDSHTLYTRKADSLQNNTEKKESISYVSLRERILLIPRKAKSYDWHGKLERNNIPGQPPIYQATETDAQRTRSRHSPPGHRGGEGIFGSSFPRLHRELRLCNTEHQHQLFYTGRQHSPSCSQFRKAVF